MHAGAVQQGLPSPASLAEVLRSTRQILLEQAGDSLLVCSHASITVFLLLCLLNSLFGVSIKFMEKGLFLNLPAEISCFLRY